MEAMDENGEHCGSIDGAKVNDGCKVTESSRKGLDGANVYGRLVGMGWNGALRGLQCWTLTWTAAAVACHSCTVNIK